jgi:uncharacterized membrane protein YgcG
MRKQKLFKFVVIPVIVFNMVCVSLAAMPTRIGTRVVDAVMNWGDKNIGGPFQKGGGDEEATRKVLTDILVPVNAWRAVLDITGGSGSRTANAQQDTPGYSQGQGVPMPGGSRKQIPIGQPSSDQAANSNGQHGPAVSPPTNDYDNFLDDDDFEGPPPRFQTVTNPRVVPVAPSNQNAVPVHPAPPSQEKRGPEAGSGGSHGRSEPAGGAGGGGRSGGGGAPEAGAGRSGGGGAAPEAGAGRSGGGGGISEAGGGGFTRPRD